MTTYKQRELDQLTQNHHNLLVLLVNDVLPQHEAATLAQSETRRQELETELERVRNEVSSLRDSGSWRITAPLRWGLGLLRRGG